MVVAGVAAVVEGVVAGEVEGVVVVVEGVVAVAAG